MKIEKKNLVHPKQTVAGEAGYNGILTGARTTTCTIRHKNADVQRASKIRFSVIFTRDVSYYRLCRAVFLSLYRHILKK